MVIKEVLQRVLVVIKKVLVLLSEVMEILYEVLVVIEGGSMDILEVHWIVLGLV